VYNPQNAVGNVVNCTKQFITHTNRHQIFFGTLEEQVGTDNPVLLVDVFLAALNAKKTNATRKALYGRPWKKEGLLPFATTARANLCGGKVTCAVPRRLFQKNGVRGWFFTPFALGGLRLLKVRF
jgi:hypothetical protein